MVVAAFAVVGVALLLSTKAATPTAFFEAEAGTRGTCAEQINNLSSASGGSAIRFCSGETGDTTTPGAHLPIDYSLSSLTGTVRYVAATGGSDSNAGTQAAPFATIAKGISASAANDTVVLRGGTYREGGIVVNKAGLKIIAYPKETPTVTGSVAIGGAWTPEGSYGYKAYTPMQTPVDGDLGIQWVSQNQNLTSNTGYIGLRPDQVWVNGTKLAQKPNKTDVTDSTFYVDTTNNRVYLSATNAAKSDIEITNKQKAVSLAASNTVLEGIRFQRFAACLHSSGNCQEADIVAGTNINNTVLRNVEVLDSSFVGVKYANNNGNLMKNVTVNSSNWMGVNATLTQNLTLDAAQLNSHNKAGEFSNSPQSGGLKTSRTWYTKVINSDVSESNSHGIWFDQSNYKMEVANSTVINNYGAGIFFEISDDLLLANNYIVNNGGSGAASVEIAASSGVKLVNNTIVRGPKDILAFYTDPRSKPGCVTDPDVCGVKTYSSERGGPSGTSVPPTMTWINGLDLMVNNIIGYPDGSGYCDNKVPFCFTQARSDSGVTTTSPMDAMFHKADSNRPQTIMSNNVFANPADSASIYRIKNTTSNTKYSISQFTSFLAGAPVSIPGLESTSFSDASWFSSDGTPTAALAAKHSQAYAIPSSITSKYPALATKHYGVLWK